MKLLLTSAGLTNNTIVHALEQLVGSSLKNKKLAFIPTAANVESGDKAWLINDLVNCQKVGFSVDIVDISSLSKKFWFPRLAEAEVLLFGGGNTFHLMHWVKESGLLAVLPELLLTRIYLGISAGSCLAGPTIYNSVQNLFNENYDKKIQVGLDFVPFQFIPHLNSPFFETIREDNLKKAAKNISDKVYAVDDSSALVVNDNRVAVVSEGKWLEFND